MPRPKRNTRIVVFDDELDLYPYKRRILEEKLPPVPETRNETVGFVKRVVLPILVFMVMIGGYIPESYVHDHFGRDHKTTVQKSSLKISAEELKAMGFVQSDQLARRQKASTSTEIDDETLDSLLMETLNGDDVMSDARQTKESPASTEQPRYFKLVDGNKLELVRSRPNKTTRKRTDDESIAPKLHLSSNTLQTQATEPGSEKKQQPILPSQPLSQTGMVTGQLQQTSAIPQVQSLPSVAAQGSLPQFPATQNIAGTQMQGSAGVMQPMTNGVAMQNGVLMPLPSVQLQNQQTVAGQQQQQQNTYPQSHQGMFGQTNQNTFHQPPVANAMSYEQQQRNMAQQPTPINQPMDTTSNNRVPPSHVLICNSILGMQDAYVTEDQRVCLDKVHVTQSLAQIFVSTYLSTQAVSWGYRVAYSHNCNRHRENHHLIQETLPATLHSPAPMSKNLKKENLVGFCQHITQSWQRTGSANPMDILLWDTNVNVQYRRQLRTRKQDASEPSLGKEDVTAKSKEKKGIVKFVTAINWRKKRRMQTYQAQAVAPATVLMERMAPLIATNLYQAGLHAREVRGAIQAGYGVLKGRNSHSEVIATDCAVIYLPCRDVRGQDVVVLPYFDYLMHLPTSVKTVDIVINRQCLESTVHMKGYASDFASTVRQFLPRSGVELVVAKPSSPDLVARLVESEYVLCGPGYGMVCLLPAIARIGSRGRFTLFDVGPDLVPGESTSTVISRLSPHLIAHVHPPRDNFAVAQLSTFLNTPDLLMNFAQGSPNVASGNCRYVRGKVGHWIEDMRYAEQAQYRTPLTHYSGNADKVFKKKVAKGETGAMQYRPATTYRWEETRYQNCQTSLLTKEGVCNVLSVLNARRIFVAGDSLSLQMAQSMWMWLAVEGSSPTPKGTLEPNFAYRIPCNGFEFTLQFVRNDEFMENDKPVSIDNKQSNCDSFCYPWTHQYMADPSKTILIANVGAHIHEFGRFKEAVDRFVNIVDRMNRPNDIVLWRTLVPGHWDCGRSGLTPFGDFAAYLKDAQEHQNPREEVYSWGKFSSYNDYVVKSLDVRRHKPFDQPRAIIEVLDVFPITVLRPDGHCSDEFKPPNFLATDCLHYDLPGPLDWWSHLAFSHLVDMASAVSA